MSRSTMTDQQIEERRKETRRQRAELTELITGLTDRRSLLIMEDEALQVEEITRLREKLAAQKKAGAV